MPNPLEGGPVERSYIIVSSDTHAGLYVEDYRAYLGAPYTQSSTNGSRPATNTGRWSRR